MKLTNGKMHVTDTPWGPLEVRQTSKSQFTVQYGKQVKEHLTYTNAAHELGLCMMHWAQCEGAWRS